MITHDLILNIQKKQKENNLKFPNQYESYTIYIHIYVITEYIYIYIWYYIKIHKITINIHIYIIRH